MRINKTLKQVSNWYSHQKSSKLPTQSLLYISQTYDWDNNSTILSSFFWGYVLPQIVAGLLAKKYGARWLLMGAMTVCSLFTLLIPVMAEHVGSLGVMTCRMIQGFAQGFIFPSTHAVLSRWAPLPERSRIGSFVYTGKTNV